MLLARLYESTPLVCPNYKADMRIVAFITDGDSVRHILERELRLLRWPVRASHP